MSSPNMNNLIIVGSICAYFAVFLLGLDTRFVSPKIFQKLCYVILFKYFIIKILDKNMGFKRWFYFGFWIDVFKNLASSFNFCQYSQG